MNTYEFIDREGFITVVKADSYEEALEQVKEA